MLAKDGNGEAWKAEVEVLLGQYSSDQRFLEWMGIPANWQTHPLWV
jgi:hypothetical protein